MATERAERFVATHMPDRVLAGDNLGIWRSPSDMASILDAYERGAWVRVTDDMSSRPPNAMEVLVALDGGHVERASYSASARGWFMDTGDLDDVVGERPTHWRPIPDAPMEKQDGR